jgi:hypothetical protein
MESDIEDNKNIEHSKDVPHPRTLCQVLLRTLLLVCFVTAARAEESSQSPHFSYAFDDEAKHLVVASCYEGFGEMLVFDVKANPYPVKPKTYLYL